MICAQNNVAPGRKNVFRGVILIFFIVLVVRFYVLQIVQYGRYVELAESNRIRIVPISAPRGNIYDRNGNILVYNESQYNLNIIPYEITGAGGDSILEKLSTIIKLPISEIKYRMRKNWRGIFFPATICEDIDFNVLTRVEEHKLEFPGVLFTYVPTRAYTDRVRASHIIGYLREIDRNSLIKFKKYGYRWGDLIGWRGVERVYETILRGKDGYDYLQVDAHGKVLGELPERKKILPRPGNDLFLTIDMELQRYCEEVLRDTHGVVILMNADNGEIISLVSKPDYDLSLFSGVVEPEEWNKLTTNPEKPLFNRATQGLYPPGSVFKLITLIAALSEGIVDTNWTVNCHGYYKLGRRYFRCWKWSGHGTVDPVEAVAVSCNVFFYTLVRKVDIDTWYRYARLFGFGEATGIDLPAEEEGLVPNRKFLDEKYGKGGWTEGMKLNLAIGQGDLLVTPVQMVKFAAILATNGKIVQPHLAMMYYDRIKERYVHFVPEVDSITVVPENVWRILRKGMYEVVNKKYGTGYLAKLKDVTLYGKTGTAQNPLGEPHSWFIGFTDTGDEKVAIAVIIEHGGSGGSNAAVVARKVLEHYYRLKAEVVRK